MHPEGRGLLLDTYRAAQHLRAAGTPLARPGLREAHFRPSSPHHLPQEQTRAFVESIVPKAQQVTPIAPAGKKGGAGSGSASAAGGLGAKEAAAKEAAARLPKLKPGKLKGATGKAAAAVTGGPTAAARVGDSGGRAAAAAPAEMSAIAEASREGSAAAGYMRD